MGVTSVELSVVLRLLKLFHKIRSSAPEQWQFCRAKDGEDEDHKKSYQEKRTHRGSLAFPIKGTSNVSLYALMRLSSCIRIWCSRKREGREKKDWWEKWGKSKKIGCKNGKRKVFTSTAAGTFMFLGLN